MNKIGYCTKRITNADDNKECQLRVTIIIKIIRKYYYNVITLFH